MTWSDKDKVFLLRDRYYGRQDAYATQRIVQGEYSGYNLVCANFWGDGCHLRLNDGIKCGGCEIKKPSPLTDEALKKHIDGKEAVMVYTLLQDNTVKYIGLDFDMKPGKEDKGYTFEEVKRISDLFTEWKVPHAIAASTGLGFHLLIFLADHYPATKARALMFHAFELVGFMQNMRMGIKPMPEIFPKQDFVGKDGYGNGLKLSMIEPNFEAGRNCWVDGNGKAITAEYQWDYFSKIPKCPTARLDELIAEHGITVKESVSVFSSAGGSGPRGSNGGKWQPPISGSIEKVLEGCAAFRRVRDKCARGEVAGHEEGFSLYHLAMNVRGGLDWYDKNVPGWGKTEKDRKQLEQSLERDYSPWTCRKMQEKGVCMHGTKCFEKKPPIEVVEGRMVERTDVPKEQWPEPSPVRYAFGTGEDFLKKLEEEVKKAIDEPDSGVRMKMLAQIVKRAQVFDDDQIKGLKEFIKKQKILKAPEIAKLFNEAAEENLKELKATNNERDDSVTINDVMYTKYDYGYGVRKVVNGKPKTVRLCSFDIQITEQRRYVDESREVKSAFHGRVRAKGFESPFEFDTAKWRDNASFHAYFQSIMGLHYNCASHDVDSIRQAAQAFSDKKGCEKKNYVTSQGWIGGAYLMPSTIVDKDGVRENTQNLIHIANRDYGSRLDFKLLPEDDFKNLLLHIKKDFLNAWPREWTTTTLAHALLPVVCDGMGFKSKPTLFFEGLTGIGKSKIAQAAQNFWGDFPRMLNITGTHKGIMDVGYDFKDALLVVDDYKGLDAYQTRALETILQYSYDPTDAVKLDKNSVQKKSRPPRCTLVITGEDFISGEASVVSRCLIIEVGKYDTDKTAGSYNVVTKTWSNYSAITAKFAHWFLLQDKSRVDQLFTDTISQFKTDDSAGSQNRDRVAYNVGINHGMWKLFVQFMLDNAAVDTIEHEALIAEHFEYSKALFYSILGRCQEEQHSVIFLRILKQLIDSKEVHVKGLSGHEDNDMKTTIGFVTPRDRDTLHVYPTITMNQVKRWDPKLRGTERALCRQLEGNKAIKKTNDGRYKHTVMFENKDHTVWSLSMKAVGCGDVDKSKHLQVVTTEDVKKEINK